jgi:hypothetical protein
VRHSCTDGPRPHRSYPFTVPTEHVRQADNSAGFVLCRAGDACECTMPPSAAKVHWISLSLLKSARSAFLRTAYLCRPSTSNISIRVRNRDVLPFRKSNYTWRSNRCPPTDVQREFGLSCISRTSPSSQGERVLITTRKLHVTILLPPFLGTRSAGLWCGNMYCAYCGPLAS